MEFTEHQLQAIDSGQPVPVEIEGRSCVVVPGSLYSRMRDALDEWDPAAMKRHMAEMMREDWTDPAIGPSS